MGVDEMLVRQSSCVNQRMRDMHCTKCQDVCPHEAIEINPSGKILMQQTCTACGLCFSKCPAQVFSWKEQQRYPLKMKKGTLEIFCNQIKCDGYIACLAKLDPYELAYLAIQAEVILCFDQAECGQCNANAVVYVQRMVKQVNAFLSAVGIKQIVFLGERKKAAEKLNRRDLLNFFFTKAKQSIGEVLPATAQVLSFRELLIDELKCKLPQVKGGAAPLFKGAKVTENCNMCGVCVRACRNQAMRIVEDEKNQWMMLQHKQSACSGCGVCQNVCPQKSLEISDKNSTLENVFCKEYVSILQKHLTICEKCGAIIKGIYTICRKCEQKRIKKLQSIY